MSAWSPRTVQTVPRRRGSFSTQRPGSDCFYDLDTPVTSHAWKQVSRVEYLPAQGSADFDLVLSYTGGEALRTACNTLESTRVLRRCTAASIQRFINQPRPCRSSRPTSPIWGPMRRIGRRRSEELLHRACASGGPSAVRDRGRPISGRFSLEQQHLLRPASSARRCTRPSTARLV